jgi:hypothetical protein
VASSIFEWRLKPKRLDAELAAFLQETAALVRVPA